MRSLFSVIFGLLFCLPAAYSQQSIPVFRTREDSVAFASLQDRLAVTAKLAATTTPDSREYDSLRKLQQVLIEQQMQLMTTRLLRMRTIYRSDPFMTRYGQAIQNTRPDEVKRVSIEGKGRTHLPDSLYLWRNLEELELVNWKLRKLPRRLNKLQSLREVAIFNNQPTGALKLSRNKTIKELTIRGDESNGHLPRRYHALRHLEILDLSRNNLTTFPNLSHSKDLKKVVLLFNELTLEDLGRKQPSSIVEINFANNKIKTVPESIGQFTGVRKLNFNNNLIDSIHPAIASLTNLEEISLYKNKLRSFPEAVYQLPRLKVIDLYYNDIGQADKRLGEMKSLEILYLANNKFYTLPDNLGQLSGLKELYLHHNRLSNLPESVGQLKSLTVLRINDNQLLEFPSSLLRLEELQNLDISNNQIQALATNDFYFKNLKIFALVGNPWDQHTRQALPAFAMRLRQNKTVVHLNSYEDYVE